MLDESEARVLKAAVRINAIVMAVAFGLLAGAILWLSTVVLLLRGGPDVGAHLSLLAVFLPGYSVTWAGAWVGLMWGMVLGSLSGAIVYLGYARTLREQLTAQVVETPTGAGIMPPVFLLSGNALGFGLGALMALQLLLTTNWLVIRGTAPYSDNAALLGQYLPGYSVSFQGSLIGAAELSAVALVLSHVLAATYNWIALWRAR